jgi:hypothetical protein
MAGPELEDEPIRIIRRPECCGQAVFEVLAVLLIQVTTVGRANSPPTSWEYSDAADCVNWIIWKRVWCAAANIHRGPQFSNRLEVLIDGKVEADPCQKLIRTIQKDSVSHRLALGITV